METTKAGVGIARLTLAGLIICALTSCTPSEENRMTPAEARSTLVETIRQTAQQIDVDGWNEDGSPEPGNCGTTAGEQVNFAYGYGAPQPNSDHDADAEKVATYWTSLGMTVRTDSSNGNPVVYGEGGPVRGLRFITAAPGDYYISGTSLCVPGSAADERVKMG